MLSDQKNEHYKVKGFVKRGRLMYKSDSPDRDKLIDDIRDRIGAKFNKMCPISLELYSAELYVLDENSALLSFKKSGKIAHDLNGKIIDFYLPNENSAHIYEVIEDSETAIDFRKLGTSIEDYAGVAFKIIVDDSTTIDGRLGNGKSA